MMTLFGSTLRVLIPGQNQVQLNTEQPGLYNAKLLHANMHPSKFGEHYVQFEQFDKYYTSALTGPDSCPVKASDYLGYKS